jgi:hypothetical protein
MQKSQFLTIFNVVSGTWSDQRYYKFKKLRRYQDSNYQRTDTNKKFQVATFFIFKISLPKISIYKFRLCVPAWTLEILSLEEVLRRVHALKILYFYPLNNELEVQFCFVQILNKARIYLVLTLSYFQN